MTPVDGGITAGMLTQLQGTRFWVRLVSIVLYVIALFSAVAGIGMLFGMEALGMGSFGYVLVALYLVSVLFYVLLGLYLFRFASAVTRSLASRAASDVHDAMTQQRKFWKLSSILGIVGCIIFAASIFVVPRFMSGLTQPPGASWSQPVQTEQ